MNVADIEHLVELVQKANISELTLRHEGARLTIRKIPAGTAVQSGELVPFGNGGVEDIGYDLAQTGSNVPSDAGSVPETVSIFSPLVGYFRHIKPMVGLGARVAKGQIVGVIEAVKLINEIIAPASGKVTDVLVDDGQAVEYGQELFTIQSES